VQWLSVVKSLPYVIVCHNSHVAGSMEFIGNECKKIIANAPATEVIVMPESALSCDALADSPELLQLWNEQHLGKAVHIIFGAFRWRDGNYYNSAHWVYNGVLHNCCDKRHAMCLSERLSVGLRCMGMGTIYCNTGPEVTASMRKRELMNIKSIDPSVFYICSELFFNEYPDDAYPHTVIIALINDSVFAKYYCATYITKLLLLLARFKAAMWQREILYVSYTQSVFINRCGQLFFFNESV
jgi:predicted amidohydrolase